ncbi:unnamed protein product [Meloidogyne enterolobii]|uniref:Uncharacterized protein n=1 Tax=Meloidogyne enterolobii TaxID=390850 RepID=A0ACB0ZT47_MELEN
MPTCLIKKKNNNLFPQILEELNREKENQQPRASSDAMQLEMERYVDCLLASPLCL